MATIAWLLEVHCYTVGLPKAFDVYHGAVESLLWGRWVYKIATMGLLKVLGGNHGSS